MKDKRKLRPSPPPPEDEGNLRAIGWDLHPPKCQRFLIKEMGRPISQKFLSLTEVRKMVTPVLP